MFSFVIPAGFVCGSCGHGLLVVDRQPYNAASSGGVVQVICRHRECSSYDKPMEFDLPRVELRRTTDEAILAEEAKQAPLLVLSHPERTH